VKQYLIHHDQPPREIPKLDRLTFGKFKGYRYEDVVDSYLLKLADDFNRDQIGIMPDQRFQFKVPLEVRERAREELKRRGWTRKGTRWQHKMTKFKILEDFPSE
jgi:hypothetical protein